MRQTLPDGTLLTTLPNGLRVILSRREDAESAALVLVVGVGSKFETKATNGLAHFLEHMVFKGTKHFPEPGSLDRAVAELGGNFNAATGVETTAYTLQVPEENVLEAMQLLGDVVAHPLLREKDIAHECTVVIEEVGDKADDPRDMLENAFAGMLFAGHGLGLPITGTPAELRRYHATDLKKLYKNSYTTENAILSVVSNASEEKVLAAAKKAFAGMEKKGVLKPVGSVFKTPKRTFEDVLEGSQAYIMVGARGPAWHAKDRPACELMMAALGGSLYARLPLLVREKLGEVYTIESSMESFVETGVCSTYTDCRPSLFKKVVGQIFDAHKEALSKPFSSEEIDLARSVLIGESVIDLDDLPTRAEFFASHLLLHGVFCAPKDIYAQWKKVTEREVNAAAKVYASPSALSLACLSPEKTDCSALLPL